MHRLILTFGLLCLLPLASHAAIVDIHVTSAADSGPNTLRQAIIDGNALPASNNAPRILIDLDGSNSIVLASPLPTLTAPYFEIKGNLPARAKIDGAGSHRILTLDPAVLLFKLDNVGLYNGYSTSTVGACVHMPGNANAGYATFSKVRIQSCKQVTNGVANGAAVNIGRNLTVTDSTFQFNQATGTSSVQGGAIALFGDNKLSITGSYLGSNRARASGGAGVGQARGGAIFIALGSSLSIKDSTLTDNDARATANNDPAASLGGAVYAALNKSMEISRSAFNSNDSGTGGAIYQYGTDINNATLTLDNNTIYDNLATQGSGGAVFSNSRLALRSNTFWKNSAAVAGDNLATDSTGVNIDLASNNLFAAGGGAGDSCHGYATALSSGYNIVPASECGIGSGSGDQITTDLHIRGAYSGPGLQYVVEMYANSPALDAGSPLTPDDNNFNACPETDMLGQPRPVDASATGAPARCDIGALEAQSEPSIFIDDFDGRWLRP